jgi:NAD(P)-dependent dehydrogenase (short-subunit alcohol dehydrogenase family)
MNGICEGRVVIVTGAGSGIGKSHALSLAAEGAHVVVNDIGSSVGGDGHSGAPAEAVVQEIVKAGGTALANLEDVSSWRGAQRLVQAAVNEFGRLDAVVNNAGILRDRMLVSMGPADWDAVVRVHLRGTFAVTRWAATYWRSRAKAELKNDARVINTTSRAGLYGNVGQINYAAAKAGIAAMTIVAAKELQKYGVTVNAISPVARTRMTEDLPHWRDRKINEDGFDRYGPDNVAPLVTWLASLRSAEVTGRVFIVGGGRICVAEGWGDGPEVANDECWQPSELTAVIPPLVARATPNPDLSELVLAS